MNGRGMRYGTGSVRAYSTAAGVRYSARFYDHAGVQREKRGFTRKSEANRYLRAQLTARDNGTLPVAGRLTLSALLGRWMAGRRVTASTLWHDEQRIRLHIAPALGACDAARITPQTLAGFYRSLHGRLGANSIRKIHDLISTAYTWAMLARLVSANPARHPLACPPTPREIAEQRRSMTVWDAATVAAFLDWCPSYDLRARVYPRLRAAWMLGLLAGLRRSEICGLDWGDVDWDRRAITIRRAVTEVSGKGRGRRLVTSAPKSGKSRTIAVSPALLAELARLPGPRQGRVFHDVAPQALTQAWSRTCRHFAAQACAAVLTVHELRHTHASLLLRAGVHPKIVQERLGHATITITMDTYSHLMPTAQAEAAVSLDRLIACSPDSAAWPPTGAG